MTQTCDVMILAAHPDDAEFGVAGTVARWTDEDREVVYVICTKGLEPHKVAEILFWAADDINFRSDISATYDQKISALHCHKSQMKAFTTSDPFGWLKNRCREMAQGESYELAEGFHRVELPH